LKENIFQTRKVWAVAFVIKENEIFTSIRLWIGEQMIAARFFRK